MSDRLGTTGPILIQSTNLVNNLIEKRRSFLNTIASQIEQLAHFVRERVVRRAVISTMPPPLMSPLRSPSAPYMQKARVPTVGLR